MTGRTGSTAAVDVRPTILVRRPRQQVAAFMFDPGNDLRWTGGITSSRPSRPGPLEPGMTVERTAKFLRRTFTYGYVVTKREPDRVVELTVDRPFPMVVRYELEDADGGTLVAIHATGEPASFFRLAAPLMTVPVRKSITADLERLRACLENELAG